MALAGEGGAAGATASGVAAVGSAEAALEGSVRRLRKLLDSTLAYVDAVVAGKTPADEAAGRAIAEAVAAVPAASDGGALERGLAGNMQDLLMVVRCRAGRQRAGTRRSGRAGWVAAASLTTANPLIAPLALPSFIYRRRTCRT